MDRFSCVDVVNAVHLQPGRKSGDELLFTCPRHDDKHPSLSVNKTKDAWLCGPCGASGNSWSLAAFLAKADPADKSAVMSWLRSHGLMNGNGHRGPFQPPTSYHEHPIQKWYVYTDSGAAEIYRVGRVEYQTENGRQKEFPIWCQGRWGLKGTQPVLYRLPKLVAADHVFIAEGEKDVETLESCGLTAATNPMGAGKWRPEYADSFHSHQSVTILPDNDEPGKAHAIAVAQSLMGKVASVKILELPGLLPKGDVSDWFAGKDPHEAVEELCIRAEHAAEFSDAVKDANSPAASEAVVVIEALPVFAERVNQKPQVKEVVRDLHAEDSIGLSHGQPRDGKTLFEQHMALSIALGRPVLGLDRFSVSSQPVAYWTEEDSERRTLERLDAMLRGFGISKRPDNFFLSVRRGITLDEVTWQQYLIKATKEIGFKYVVIDPLRAFTAHADQGPSELKPLVLFLRRFMTETGCSVCLVHHDTKPIPGKGDDRKRSHRASGGGIFSIADAPLSFERISDNHTLVVPCGFKFSETPSPFRFTLKTEHQDSRLVSIQLVGEDVLRSEAEGLSVNETILEFIKKTPGKSGSAIATAIGKRKDHVLVALNQLLASGRVDGVEKGKSTLWFLRST